jgi:hypothetical protein
LPEMDAVRGGPLSSISAHGLGGAADLPISAPLAIAGGTAALAVSFVVLLVAWKQPRFAQSGGELLVPPPLARAFDGSAWRTGLRVVGMAFFVYMLWPALFGPNDLTNPLLGVAYSWLWVGLVPLSLVFGPAVRALSPARTLLELLDKAAGRPDGEGLVEYPERLGYWPASIGLFTFVWLELIAPLGTDVGVLRLWFAAYFAAMLLGWGVFGTTWIARADPFEVYSTLVGRLAPWGRSATGRLVVVSPLRNLSRMRPARGLVAVVAVLLGSTAYDSWRSSTTWVRYVQSNNIDVTRLGTALMVLIIVTVGVTFTLACMATPGDVEGPSRRELPGLFAHSLVPIIVGYMVAHYLTFLVEYGQQTLIYMSDPVGSGANLFGTADMEIAYWLTLNPTVLASIKVVAIVVGHVLGVIAAHDRALEVLPRRHHVTGQLALLVAMVSYTFMGLYLLFGS